MNHLAEDNYRRPLDRDPLGFTLLELLLATVLATVLMVGVMAVVTDLGVSRSHIQPPPAGSDASKTGAKIEPLDAWARLLCEDIRHASAINTSRKGVLALTGYNALDPSRLRRTHRPVRVLYEFRDIDGRKWIIRRQTALDVLTNQNVRRDLVCCGVSRFELTPITVASKRPDDEAPEKEDLAAEVTKAPAAPKKQHAVKGLAGADRKRTSSIIRSSDGRISILVDGQYYYPKYAPEWARKKYAGELAGLGGIAGAPSIFNKRGKKAIEKQDIYQDDGSLAVGTLWRLRVWTSNSKETAYDRILSVPWGRRQ